MALPYKEVFYRLEIKIRMKLIKGNLEWLAIRIENLIKLYL